MTENEILLSFEYIISSVQVDLRTNQRLLVILQLLNFPQVQIHIDLPTSNRSSTTESTRINCGKSVYYKVNRTILDVLEVQPLHVLLYELSEQNDDKLPVLSASCSVPLRSIVSQIRFELNNAEGVAMHGCKGRYKLFDAATREDEQHRLKGYIELACRVSCLGSNLLTLFPNAGPEIQLAEQMTQEGNEEDVPKHLELPKQVECKTQYDLPVCELGGVSDQLFRPPALCYTNPIGNRFVIAAAAAVNEEPSKEAVVQTEDAGFPVEDERLIELMRNFVHRLEKRDRMENDRGSGSCHRRTVAFDTKVQAPSDGSVKWKRKICLIKQKR